MCPRAILNVDGEDVQFSKMAIPSASRGGMTVLGELRFVEGDEAGSKSDSYVDC
jgi:hypothetical protein